nr:hypothetical protein [Tanacetum cinerariifolium]
ALELSVKEQEERTHGPARPVVFREPDSGRFQPFPEVQGKGKEKVIKEQTARDLLTLQTPKKKIPIDQFIFQRCTPMTNRPSGNDESPSLDAVLAFADNEIESDEPDISMAKDTKIEVTHTETLVTASEFEQTSEEQIHKEFNSMIYPNVQDNLMLPVKEQVILEEPASSTETLFSLHHLDKDTSSVPPMTFKVLDLPRPRPDDPNVHSPLSSTTLAATLITATITTSTITPTVKTATPLLSPSQPLQSLTDTSIKCRLDDAFTCIADLVQANLNLEERLRKVESHYLSVDWAMLPAVDMKEILQQQMFEDNSYKAHEVHNNLFEALQKSSERDYSNQLLADLDEARRKKINKRDSPRTPSGSLPSQPPPLPPPAGSSGALGSQAPSSSKITASTSQSMAWTTSDTRYESASFVATQETSPIYYLMNDDSIPSKQVHLSDDEDTRNDHLPKAKMKKD